MSLKRKTMIIVYEMTKLLRSGRCKGWRGEFWGIPYRTAGVQAQVS